MEATTNSSAEQHTKLQLELETDTEAEAPTRTATATATTATIIDIPAVAAASCHISCSAFSSSYDTDCSTASSTCCTRQGEQIYMQRDTALHKSSSAAAAAAATQSVTVSAPAAVTATAATTNASSSPMVCNMQQLGADADEVAMLKFEHRKHWPWFILLISVIEVSFEVHSTRSLFQFFPFTASSNSKHSLFRFQTF